MALASLLGLVSLCRLGGAEVPAPGVRPRDHVEVWLIDSAGPARKPNLAEDFRSQVCRGQRNDERLRETPEPGVVVLITQKSRE